MALTYEIAKSMEAVHQESGQLQLGQQEQSVNVVNEIFYHAEGVSRQGMYQSSVFLFKAV